MSETDSRKEKLGCRLFELWTVDGFTVEGRVRQTVRVYSGTGSVYTVPASGSPLSDAARGSLHCWAKPPASDYRHITVWLAIPDHLLGNSGGPAMCRRAITLLLDALRES